MITIDDQIDCVRNEIDRRKRILPKLVEKETMSQERALMEIATMEQVLHTLSQLRGMVKV
jgi:hypothetical protein